MNDRSAVLEAITFECIVGNPNVVYTMKPLSLQVYRQDIDMNSREYQMDQMAITGYRRTIPERL